MLLHGTMTEGTIHFRTMGWCALELSNMQEAEPACSWTTSDSALLQSSRQLDPKLHDSFDEALWNSLLSPLSPSLSSSLSM